jgi:ABC-type lipoprotein export system ATPase subunit
VIRLEFIDFLFLLEFFPEYSVGVDPKKIDIVIVKKDLHVSINKNIGFIFKTHNLIEYKSYKLSLSLSEYDKAHGRARFYVSE